MNGLYFVVIGERRLEMGGASTNQQKACSVWGSWDWQTNPESNKACSYVCGWETAERFVPFCLTYFEVTLMMFWMHYLRITFTFPGPAEFGCSICRAVIKEPLTTPCAHNFCKACLLGAYDSQASMRERSRGGRTLRAQKIVKKCPSCPTDICDFLENPQVWWSISLLKGIYGTQIV